MEPLQSISLNTLRSAHDQAQQRLTDEQKTAFFFVTLPEALPIAVISRFIGWFQDFGIPVGGVIVNLLVDKAALGQDVPEFQSGSDAGRVHEEHLGEVRRFGSCSRSAF